ncbi:MAG: DUF86 domain-containing protein [Leptolyngbyaceae cyanobacterium]
MSRDHQAIQDMWNAAQDIVTFTAGMSLESLSTDRRTQAAVLYEIIVVGKAANRLSREFQAQHPDIPWKDIIGMRNILAHQYDEVGIEEVWDVVRRDIPELITLIEPLIRGNSMGSSKTSPKNW